jgi:arylsulfatase A-like enzyme
MERPNILIFMTDQQRGDTTPPYGKAKMPNLDKFCKEGMTFSQAYTIAPHCCPSRATFFSGLYPSQHGVWNNVSVGNTLSKGLYDGIRLWSEDLRDAGYQMHFHGKWHVSEMETPADRGFSKHAQSGIKKEYKHERPHASEWEKYDHLMDQQESRKDGEIIRKGYPPYIHYGTKENPFNDGSVVEEAINAFNQREKEKPWCQYIGTLGPHDPYFVPEKYLDMYKVDEIELPSNYADRMMDKPALYRKTRDRFDQLSELEHKEAIRHYLAFCTYEDALFGQVLKALEHSGEADNTLVVFLSDHGDYMAEHGLWCKGLPCFRGAYHIPMAIRWPKGLRNPGRTSEAFVTLADCAPTLLEAAGVQADRTFTGSSLMPFLLDEQPQLWRDAVFTQTNGNELYGIQRSVMTKEWKYVYNGFDYEELYDLNRDPDECTNLFGAPEYDEVVKKMSKRIWSFAREVDDVCINPYVMVALAPYGPGEG